ncbi:hypothetical protein ACXEO8_20180 [Cytobacillus firmus]
MELCTSIEQKPVIAAWGVNSSLRELATVALLKLPSCIIGLQGEESYHYYHPLPRGKRTPKKWLEEFVDKVKIVNKCDNL